MNTNPNAKRILCFGDSNTWGRLPGDDNSARFPSNVRWTGVLQDLLGNDFEIIEEGLNARTTNLDSPDKPGKNGSTFLFPCLESQKPLDVIIFQLGKNSLKKKYDATPTEITMGLEECLNVVNQEGRTSNDELPQVVILPVLPIVEKVGMHAGRMENAFLGAAKKSIELKPLYEEAANKWGAIFLDITQVAKVSEIDGIHMDAETHATVARMLADYLKGQL